MNSLADALRAIDVRDYPRALAVLDSLSLDGSADQATILFYMGWCRELQGGEEADVILSCYERASILAKDPVLGSSASFRAGWVLLTAGAADRADSWFARAAERLAAAGIKNALYCHASYWQAAGLERSGRYLDAVERYREVARLDDALRGECLFRQIQCLTSVGALDEALSVCEEAEELLRQDSQPRALELRSLIAQEQDSLRAAIDAA